MASSARNPATSTMHSAMQTQCSTDFPVRFLFANWRLMTSSFSAIAFRSSACGAAIVSTQQGADRRLQCLREGKQQVGIWDGKPLFPFRDRLPHDMQL